MGLLHAHERHGCRLGEADLVADSKKSGDGAAAEPAVVHATATPPYTVSDVHIDPQDQDDAVVPAPMAPPGASVVGARPAQQPHNPAQWMHERLVHQIIEFEKGLGDGQEIGGRFVQGPGSEPLHITNLASWGPDMILFMGEYPDGRKFELLKNFKDQPHNWGDPIS